MIKKVNILKNVNVLKNDKFFSFSKIDKPPKKYNNLFYKNISKIEKKIFKKN